jgi:hypothetical protein
MDDTKACAMTALELRCVDPAWNMRRFYRLDVQPDLFGGVLLLKEWGWMVDESKTHCGVICTAKVSLAP